MKKLWIACAAAVLVVVGILGYTRYQSAKSHYAQGLQLLQSLKWDEARSAFANARSEGMVYFQDGELVTGAKEKEYGDAEYTEAVNAFNVGDFSEMEKHLKNIPSTRVELVSKAGELHQKNPMGVELAKIIDLDKLSKLKIQYLALAEGIPAILVQGEDGEGNNRIGKSYIILYDPDSKSFKIGYQAAKQYFQEAKLDYFEPFNDKRKAVLASQTSYGASAFATQYVILAYNPAEKSLKQYLDITGFKSSTEFKNNHLIVHGYEKDMEYEWNGDQFSGKRIFLQPQIDTSAVIIHYSITNKQPLVSTTNVTLKLGQKLTFIRDDQLAVGKRLMLSANGTVNHDKSNTETFVGNAEGTTDITLVPNGGYDWDHAVKVIINVIQ